MKTYRFDDKLQIPSTRKIQDTGQMLAEGAIARAGVLTYQAKDLGSLFADRDPDSLVRVAQLSDNLFAEETLDKFRSAPITIGHPEQDVDTHNMKELGKGTLEGRPFADGNHLAANLVLSDQEAIDLVNSGVHELSVRAYYELQRCDDAEGYDAIRIVKSVNHVAIVERGRAGVTCRISDSEDGEVSEEMFADVKEIVTEETKAVEGTPENIVEDTKVVEENSELETLKQQLSDALARITALEQANVVLDDAEEESETPMSQVMKTVNLSDASSKQTVSAAEQARLRMIERYKHNQ